MYPILYESITTGQVPAHNGLGVLSDCISCTVEAEKNTIYELTMEYPRDGIHAEELLLRRVIKIKPNPTDNPQLFRIDRIGKTINGRFTVYAKHISYDLSGYDITSGTANSIVAACALLQAAASGYTITTDKTTSGTFKIDTPASVRSYFGGREGSILDIYGKTEIKYDNFTVSFLQNAGQNRGVTIRYGKNLLELSQEIGSDNLYTHVRGFYKDQDGNVTNGDKVATGLTLDTTKTLVLDFSSDFDSTPTAAQLTAKATEYKNRNNLTTPKNNIKLDFVQSGELTNRVDLCDTVAIYYEALGITRTEAQCIRTKYDCIREKYIETEFGDTKANLADTILQTTKEIEEKPNTTAMEKAVKHATEMITGNLGGYVILHDSNGDGEPDEILIMNTPDIATATQVWRWNKNGLGFATSYTGQYGTAITQDGQIVADYITTGVLNAGRIKAGVLSDTGNNSTINMTTGEAKLKNLTARQKLVLVDANNNERGNWQFTGTECHFAIRDTNLQNVGEIWSNANGGQIRLSNTSQKYAVSISTENDGGSLGLHHADGTSKLYLGNSISLYHTNGNTLARITRNGYGRGQLDLYNEYGSSCVSLFGDGGLGLGSGGSFSITGIGSTGVLTCVQLVQTSSRKVKKNIEEMTDTEKILELRAVRFDFIKEEQGTDQRGFIAEEVAEILPNLVTPETEESPAGLNYIGMIPYLQDLIKKQQKRIDELEQRIATLEKKIAE